jgi:DNA polymerase III subunit gamma/tau
MQAAPVPESLGVSGSTALAAQPAQPEPAGEIIPFPSAPLKQEIRQQPVVVSTPLQVEEPARAKVEEPARAKVEEPASAPQSPTTASVPPSGSLDAEAVKQAIVAALSQQRHASASQLISTARFTLEATSLRIEVPGIGKKMLALTVNPAAEKIVKQELQRLGGPARFMVIPGEGVAATTPVAAPAAGSIQQAAMEHPMVQRAKEIFNADIRSVVDLRNK